MRELLNKAVACMLGCLSSALPVIFVPSNGQGQSGFSEDTLKTKEIEHNKHKLMIKYKKKIGKRDNKCVIIIIIILFAKYSFTPSKRKLRIISATCCHRFSLFLSSLAQHSHLCRTSCFKISIMHILMRIHRSNFTGKTNMTSTFLL